MRKPPTPGVERIILPSQKEFGMSDIVGKSHGNGPLEHPKVLPGHSP